VKIPAYLQQNRYEIYHFRRVAPHDLRFAIAKREFIKSLRTRDPKKAIKLARLEAFQTEKLLSEIKKRHNLTTITLGRFQKPVKTGLIVASFENTGSRLWPHGQYGRGTRVDKSEVFLAALPPHCY